MSLILLGLLLCSFSSNKNYISSNYFDDYFNPVNIPCNTDVPVPITELNYSDLEVTSSTSGLCLIGCGINNEDNLIDGDDSNYTSVNTVVGLGVTHTLKVTDNTTDEFYSAGSFAGFFIENASVVQVDLFDGIVIRTYLNGVEQESNTSSALVSINSDLLADDQYYVGFDTTLDFDAIEISISSFLGVASSTRVFHAVVNSFCEGPALECNTPTRLAKPDFPAKIVQERTGFGGALSVGNINEADAAVDSNANSYASINFALGVLASGSLSIKDELSDYPAMTYAGFDIENSSVLNLNLLDGITISTYLDGAFQESKTGSSELLSVDSALLLSGSERSQVGFVSNLPFDEVQLTINQTVSLDLGSTKVYGLILESFCEGELECSTSTVLNNPSQPVIINNGNTGVDGVACVGCEVDEASNVISESNSDFAQINIIAGVANTASISVLNVLESYPAGSKAGFVIRDTNDLLELDLLNSITLTTYLDGVVQESQTSSGLLALEALGFVSITPSSTDGFYLIGFETALEYDEIQITVGAVAAVINSIEVYGSYVDTTIQVEATVVNESTLGLSDGELSITVSGGTPPYSYAWSPGGETSDAITGLAPGIYSVTVTDALDCETTAEFIVYTEGVQYPVPCNTENPVPITAAGFTDLSITKDTSGVCVLGCGVANENNIIDANDSNYATVSTVVGLGVTHTLTTTDETVDEFFEGGGYAGYLIENSSILQADLLDAIVVKTYLDGVEQESQTSTSLAVINSTLLGGDQYYVGFYTTMDYDAVEISISSLLNVLSDTHVYHAVTNRFCEGPDLACNTPTALTKPDFPVRIVEEHTGTGGLLGVGSVNNTENLFDANAGNYATIDLLAGVAASASIAVKDELTDYPATTYAGFDIENATLLNTQLFDAITISTYLDGALVESRTGTTELVPVNSGVLLTGNEAVRIGFVTTSPFDEVQISLSQLVSLNLGSTRVYNMVLERFCPGTIDCESPYVLSNPNDSVIINNNRTGTEGIACVACEVDNSQNVISEDGSDFALINIVAGVASTASISVQDVLLDYPSGTQAGFVIRDTNDLLQVDLLNSITLTTYLDGVQQEQKTAGNLLALEALGLITITPTTTDGLYIVAFNTTMSFDEVQITIASLASVINSIEIYGGYVDATNSNLCDTANIAVIKTVEFNDENADGFADVGETLTYNFTVTNEGSVDLSTVVLTDAMLGGELTLISGDTDGDNELDVDEIWLYTANYTLTQADVDAGSVSNQANITSINGDDGTEENDLSDDDSVLEDDFTVIEFPQRAGIAVIKTGVFNDENSDGYANLGETITYSFTVTNQGQTTITDVVLTDAMLGGELALASGDDNGDNILDVDEVWLYAASYTITQADIDAGVVSNQALVTGTSSLDGSTLEDLSDDDTVFEDDITDTELPLEAGIAVIKTGIFNDENSDGYANIGETITYNFTVTNQGEDTITDVVLTDDMLGGELTLGSGDDNGDNILDVDEVWLYAASYTITQADIDAGVVSNQALVTGTSSLDGSTLEDLSDDDTVFEDDITDTELPLEAGIAVIKTGVFNDENSDGYANIGETITYNFTVTNQGQATITDVVLTDAMLGGELTLASGDDNGDNILDVDEVWLYAASYTITQADIDAGVVSNQAVVTGTSSLDGSTLEDLSDDDTVFEDDITDTELPIEAGIAVIKTGVFNDENSDGYANLGETITYNFTVTNQGQTTITDVVLTDAMLGGEVSLASGDDNGDNILDVDEIWLYAASYTITQADIDAGIVSNQALVTGTSSTDGSTLEDLSDDDTVFEDDITDTILPLEAGIAVIKTGVFNDENSDGYASLGETITYNFTVTNQGEDTITDVVLTDDMLGGEVTLASGDDNGDNILDVDEIWLYAASYTITQADIDAGVVSNQALVTGTSSTDGSTLEDLSDDDTVFEDDITDTILPLEAGIAVIKTGIFNDENSDGYANIGETITYNFTVTNQGEDTITDVVLTDAMLGGEVSLASGDDNGDNILDVDEIWLYAANYTITQADIDAGVVSNQAFVTGTSSTDGSTLEDLSDDDTVFEDDITDTVLPLEAGIAVIKTGVFNDENSDGYANIGETITYNFTVTNQGQATITDVVLTDAMLGGEVSLASGDDNGDNILDVDEVWLYAASYTITQADIDTGMVSNQALVTGTSSTDGSTLEDLSDDDTVFEDDITDTELPLEAGIAVIKTGFFNDENSDDCSNVGETITYSFTVTNEGNVSVRNIELIDDMLGGVLSLVSGDDNEDEELDVNETWIYAGEYTLTQADIDAGMVSNQAVLSGESSLDGSILTDLSDDDSVLEDDTTIMQLCNSGSISLEKVGEFNDENGNGVAEAGETLSYWFTVYNTGVTTLYNISIDDPLPGVQIEGGPIIELGPNDIDDFTFIATYTLTEDDVENGEVINQAVVEGENENGIIYTDTSDDPNNLDDIDLNNDNEPDDPTVVVLPQVLGAEFEIFNGITPDGNGENDFFRIVGIEDYPDNNLKIYNRWGILIYDMDSYGINGNEFRGISEGRSTINKDEKLPTGTYFYILRRFVGGKTLTNEGYLYIKNN